jgi:hypothetical protein
MRGITEERLKDLFKEYSFIGFILAECAELNAWQPIETAPLRKKIRLFEIGPNEQCDGEILFEYDRKFYTHWQELPENPK